MLFERQLGENLENGQTPSWCRFVQKKISPSSLSCIRKIK